MDSGRVGAELHMAQVKSGVACPLGSCHKLLYCQVRWFTDNQNVVRILRVGSKKPTLQAIALKVFALVVTLQDIALKVFALA